MSSQAAGAERDTGRDSSPYVELDRAAWADLATSTEQPLTPEEIREVRGLSDRLDLDEVNEVYLPLSRLLSLYVESAGALHRAGGCARSLQDLVFAMTNAIDTRDANRLASVYHWPGTSADSGYRIWTRLDAIANRPLIDIVPMMSAGRPPPAATTDETATSNDAAEATNASVDPELYPQTAVRRNPVALRVEQTVGNSATPARTVFGLTHYFGCWWVRF